MARNIAADANDAWRAVLVFKRVDNQELVYHYEGIYNKAGTAKARVSFWRGYGKKAFPQPDNQYEFYLTEFYDGWIEKADVIWNKVKD